MTKQRSQIDYMEENIKDLEAHGRNATRLKKLIESQKRWIKKHGDDPQPLSGATESTTGRVKGVKQGDAPTQREGGLK